LFFKPASTEHDYELGVPFIRAFHVVFNYNNNLVGFGNKIRNFGAQIVGKGAPGPE
jgi:hypothetical protein